MYVYLELKQHIKTTPLCHPNTQVYSCCFLLPLLSLISLGNRCLFVEFRKKSGINASYLPNRSLKNTK